MVGVETPSDREREFAKEVAQDAMIMGWEDAVNYHSKESGIDPHEVKLILNRVSEWQDGGADQAGRIDELKDWEVEKKGRSTLKPKVQGNPN